MTGIYYSDLFVINGKGCLIMGIGKSKVCRYHTGKETKEIGTDSIRLELSNQKLFGYYDVLMGMLPIEKSQMRHCEIHYLIRMLNEEETSSQEIKEISKNDFIGLCNFNITYEVADAIERINEFRQLISNCKVVCLTVPWCKTMEDKGKMISEFIK